MVAAGLFFAGAVWAASARPAVGLEGRRLAVLEFRGEELVGVPVVRELADGARSGALDAAGATVLIHQDENRASVLREMGRSADCTAEACDLEIGRTLGADWIVTGEVSKVEEVLRLRMKLFDTATGTMRGTAVVEAARPLALVRAVRRAAARMVEEGLDASSRPKGIEGSRTSGVAGRQGTAGAIASGPVILAVLGFRGSVDSGLLDLMADDARAAAVGLDGRYVVLDGQSTAASAAGEREARAGLELSGNVRRIGGLLVVTLELREMGEGMLLKTERVIAPSELALLRSVRASTARLLSQADDGVRSAHP